MATESAEHDPTGLDLARQVAASIGASSTGRRRRPKRKRTEGQVSGAHPDDRDPQLLGRAMDRLMDSKGWTAEVNVHTILGRWQVLVGPMMAQHTTPESYRDNVITVRATSTAWATQLRGLAPRIVASLNEKVEEGMINSVRAPSSGSPSSARTSRPGTMAGAGSTAAADPATPTADADGFSIGDDPCGRPAVLPRRDR